MSCWTALRRRPGERCLQATRQEMSVGNGEDENLVGVGDLFTDEEQHLVTAIDLDLQR